MNTPNPSQTPEPDTPDWQSLDSVTPDQPTVVPNTAPHPFDAPSRAQVLLLVVAVAVLLALSVIGWWQAAVWGLVVVLLALAGFRLTNRHAWTRARGTVFDVTVLVVAAVGIALVMLVLPE
ncbi:intracellular motility protein A [uncultured Mobiluncus sp.]|uniref:intracellular motility protein A n=1 Tax=uncultured Mobiluncus sp. TaxID=293425 RepID=UPI002637E709|nr:intracellular motility protein A [uncultured Mobiluncus sp.]